MDVDRSNIISDQMKQDHRTLFQTGIQAKLRSMATTPQLGTRDTLKIVASLSWRDRYCNQPYFHMTLEPPPAWKHHTRVRQERLRIRQLPNGELTGLGTGATVWPAACVFIKFLQHQFESSTTTTTVLSDDDDSKNLSRIFDAKRIIELGSGTGAVGLAFAKLMHQRYEYYVDNHQDTIEIVLTDQAPLMSLMESNKQLNPVDSPNIKLSVEELNWGKDQPLKNHTHNLILISDCILPQLYPIEPLVETLDVLCHDDTLVLLSYEHRYYREFHPKERFEKLLREHGLELKTLDREACHHPQYQVDDIELWLVSRKVLAK